MKQKRGELIGYNGCLGYVYDKDTKEISINYEEAEIVRYIFERYCQGVGCTTIAKELTNMKYKTPTGKKKWHESTIRGILKNEKYKGDVLQGKTYTTDPISHRRVVNMGEENQQSSYEVSKNYLQPMCEPCGMLLGAISQKFDTIIEFTAFENFCSFERKGKNKIKRVGNHKIKVTIEVDMVFGVV